MDLATRRKWIAGAKPAAPLFLAVSAALTVGTFTGVRHLLTNPEVTVSKETRAFDMVEGTRAAKSIEREGSHYHESAFRRYLRGTFFTGDKGTLDNSQPFLMRTLYGEDKS